MKKLLFLVPFLALLASCEQNRLDNSQQEVLLTKSSSDKPLQLNAPSRCITIQSGLLKTSAGEVIKPGYLANGYNYQAHIYNGEYSPGWHLEMKWNNAWLSNEDCNGDGKLDRPTDNKGTYIGSGAWVTNHWTSVYNDESGKRCKYVEFTKIVAVPEGARLSNNIWYNADGTEIGAVIWGSFAIIQSIVNDPCGGIKGKQYKSPDHAGLGNW